MELRDEITRLRELREEAAGIASCYNINLHVHKYVNEEGLIGFYPSERLDYNGMKWTPEITEVKYFDYKLKTFEYKNMLIDRKLNIEALKAIEAKNNDYKEYEFSYNYSVHFGCEPITGYPMPVETLIGRAWTTNPNVANLTGEERVCHHMYRGCRVAICYDTFSIVYSDWYDSIDQIPEVFDKIQVNEFDTIVDLKDRKEIDKLSSLRLRK